MEDTEDFIQGVIKVVEEAAPDQQESSAENSSSRRGYNLAASKKSKKQASKSHPNCQICGRSSGIKSAFGGRSCPSCRIFFQRSVAGKRVKRYICLAEVNDAKETDNCDLDYRQPKICQKCRYQKCVQVVGMKPELVPSKMKASSTSESKNSSAVKNQLVRTQNSPEAAVPRQKFTLDETLILQGLHRKITGVFATSVLSFGENVLRCYCETLARGADMSWEVVLMVNKMIRKQGQEILSNLGDLLRLKEPDREILIRANFPVMTEIITSAPFDSPTTTRKYFRRIFSKILRDPSLAKYKSIANAYNITEDFDFLPVQYTKFYHQDTYKDPEILSRHKEIYLSLSTHTRRDPLDPDKVEDEIQSILIAMIALFNPGKLDLSPEGAEIATQVQQKYSYLLYKYLCEKHDGDVAVALLRHAEAITAGDLARESEAIKRKALIVSGIGLD